jgi:hypothetical protein
MLAGARRSGARQVDELVSHLPLVQAGNGTGWTRQNANKAGDFPFEMSRTSTSFARLWAALPPAAALADPGRGVQRHQLGDPDRARHLRRVYRLPERRLMHVFDVMPG